MATHSEGGVARDAVAPPGRARSRTASGVAGAAFAHPAATAFVVALVVRVVSVMLLAGFFSGSLVLDDATYTDMALQKAANQTAHWDDYTHQLYDQTATLLVPLTIVYRMTDASETAGRLLVALAGAAVAAVVALLASWWTSRGAALAAGLIVALLPSQVLWSSLTLKDTVVWLLVAALGVIVAVAARVTGPRLLVAGIACGMLLYLLGHARLHTLVIASWALMIAALVPTPDRVWRFAGAALLAISVPWVVGLGPAGLIFVANAGSLELERRTNAIDAATAVVPPLELDPLARVAPDTAAHVQRLREESDRLEAAATTLPPRRAQEVLKRAAELETRAAELEATALAAAAPPGEPAPAAPGVPSIEGSISADIRHLPRGLAVMLVEPVPWRPSTSPAVTFAKLEMILWYPLLLLAAVGLVTTWRKLEIAAFPLLAAGATLVMYALAEGNVGTAFRHRGELVWVAALLAAAGGKVLLDRRRPASVGETG